MVEKDRELFEVKYVKRLTDLEQECEKAVMQIDDRMYAKALEDRYDQVSRFGIAFYKKRCLIQKK
ncbi:MAG: PD-(D/E)XK nuclease domain-containing protein [Gallintestinimicrobium sp.]